MRRCSSKPYEGKEQYIFISYCHKDRAFVYPIVERLARDGYRVWYDEGIDPGSEWPEIIAHHLNNSAVCIAFLSENALNSHNCRREINFALVKKKSFISVILEQVSMSLGMEMQLSATQAIFKYTLSSEEDFFEKLYSAQILEPCLGEPDPDIVISTPEDYEEDEQGETGLKRKSFSDQWFSDTERQGFILLGEDVKETNIPPEVEEEAESVLGGELSAGGSEASEDLPEGPDALQKVEEGAEPAPQEDLPVESSEVPEDLPEEPDALQKVEEGAEPAPQEDLLVESSEVPEDLPEGPDALQKMGKEAEPVLQEDLPAEVLAPSENPLEIPPERSEAKIAGSKELKEAQKAEPVQDAKKDPPPEVKKPEEKTLPEEKPKEGKRDQEKEPKGKRMQEKKAEEKGASEKKPGETGPEEESEVPLPRKRRFAGKMLLACAGVLALVVGLVFVLNSMNQLTICGDVYDKDKAYVHIENTNVTAADMKAAASMKKLSSLAFTNCTIDDAALQSLGDISSLYTLRLQGCELTDAQLSQIPFSKLTQLTEVSLDDNPSLTTLGTLTEASGTLASLSVKNTAIVDFAPLGSSSELRVLDASGTGMVTISFPEGVGIRRLNVSGNQIADLAPLAEYLDSLVELRAADNQITNLLPLSGSGKLECLDVSRNQLTSLEGLELSLKLSELQAAGNAISDIAPLANCTVLETVNLNDNVISDISLLGKSAATLEKLYLSGNQIQDISALAHTKSLERLNLDGNAVTTLEPLAESTKLCSLSADYNRLRSASGLENALELQYIYLSHNEIVDASSLSQRLAHTENTVWVLDLSHNNIQTMGEPNGAEISAVDTLSLYENPLTSLDVVKSLGGTHLLFSYIDGMNPEGFSAAFSKFTVLDCPLDKRLMMDEALSKVYSTVFASAEEADNLMWESKSGDFNITGGAERVNGPARVLSDVSEDAWYADAVYYVVEAGIMSAEPDLPGDQFFPDRLVTMAELCEILWKTAGCPDTGICSSQNFEDPTNYDENAWYAKAVSWCYLQEIIYDMALFEPDELVSRADSEALFSCYASEYLGAEAFAQWEMTFDLYQLRDDYNPITRAEVAYCAAFAASLAGEGDM